MHRRTYMKNKTVTTILLLTISILIIGTAPSFAVEKAPNFSLKDINGKTVKLSDYKGKVVLLNFWATWCGPCKREIPDLVTLHNTYKKKGAVVLSIALDQQGTSIVKPFVEKNKITYPVLIGDTDVVQAYGNFTGIPTTVVIDKKGFVQNTLTGMQSKETFEGQIKQNLK